MTVIDGTGVFTRPTLIRGLYLVSTPNPAPDVALDNAVVPMRNPFPFVDNPSPLHYDLIIVPARVTVLRDALDAKRWSEAWKRDRSYDAGIDLVGEAGARQLYVLLVQEQGPDVRPPPLLLHHSRTLNSDKRNS